MRQVLVSTALLVGCAMPPRFVQSSDEVDMFLAREDFRSACVGLAADDPGIREYTADKLADYPTSRIANGCLCDALQDVAEGFDEALGAGLVGSKREDLAACLAPVVEASAGMAAEERAQLVGALGGIGAPGSFALLGQLAKGDADPGVRAAAVRGLRPSAGSVAAVVELLKTDADPRVRVAAAEALVDRDDKVAVTAIVAAATGDASGEVRGAALRTAEKRDLPEIDAMLCKAMMSDADPVVRKAAVGAAHGTKKKARIACLKERLLTEEVDGGVREAVLAALGASPADDAAKVLCEAIGPYTRLYVKDTIADRIPGANIVEAQNNRDWQRSYECVERALAQGGYSCYARNHLGHWMNTLGGKASTPWCPGMQKL